MKRLALILCVILHIAAPVSAATFSDDFDRVAFTDTSWDALLGTWDHVVLNGLDLGYHGTSPDNSGIGSAADNQQYYFQTNLSVETLLRIDSDESVKEKWAGLIFISGSFQQSDYVEYIVAVGTGYDDDLGIPVSGMAVMSNSVTPSGETSTQVGFVSVSITVDTFYRLQVSTDAQGDINLSLYDANSNLYLGGLSDVSLATPYDSGMVGVITVCEATFNNFSLTGTAVPSRSSALSGVMMLLLGTE